MALSLAIEGLDAGYGAVKALRGVTLHVEAGETVALLGTNGNGKSTLMKCIMGLVRPDRGRMSLTIDGKAHDLTKLSTEAIVDLGVALVPEGRRLFPKLTVTENLMLGAFRKAARQRHRAKSRAGVRDLSGPEGAPQPARRHHVRRTAADARDCARADVLAAAAADRRALGRAVAATGVADHRQDRRTQRSASA